MATDLEHKYSNEDIYDDFKLEKTCWSLMIYTKILQ